MLEYLTNMTLLNWYAVASVFTGVWFIYDLEQRFKQGKLKKTLNNLATEFPDAPHDSLLKIATVLGLLAAMLIPPLFYVTLFKRHMKKGEKLNE